MDCGDSRFLMLESELPRDVFESIKEYMVSERLDAAKRLSAWFAHEINNPLGAILGSAQLLERRLDNDIDDARKLEGYKRYLGIIQDQIERCAQVTGESLSSLNIGEPSMERVNAAEAVADAIGLIQYSYSDADISICADSDPVYVKADRQWLMRIIFELISNALEASREAPVVIRISDCMTTGSKRVCIRVEDSCCGIPESIRWKIFVPYFSTREKSCGIGLSLSLEMAIRMNGDLVLEDASKEGSIFLVTLPVWMANDEL